MGRSPVELVDQARGEASMTTPRVLRVACCILAAAIGVWWMASPALAHSRPLPDSSHYRSTITAIQPRVPGLALAVTRADGSLTLTNHTGRTVVVIGYAGEPYLRITTTGVDENVASLSSWLNGRLPQPPAPASQRVPQWRHVSDRPTFIWHDYRTHWMGLQRPPVVAADPRHPHKVQDWTVPLTVGGEPVAVKGSLNWTGLTGLSTLAIALIAVAGTVGVGLAVAMAVVVRKERAAERVPPEPIQVSD
jgi:hypothetical protein